VTREIQLNQNTYRSLTIEMVGGIGRYPGARRGHHRKAGRFALDGELTPFHNLAREAGAVTSVGHNNPPAGGSGWTLELVRETLRRCLDRQKAEGMISRGPKQGPLSRIRATTA